MSPLFTSLWMMVTRLGISNFAYWFFSCEVFKRKHRLNSYYDRAEWIISGCKMHFAAWTSFGHVWVVSYLYKVPVRYAQSVKSVTYHDRHGHDPVRDPFLLSGRLGHQLRHQLLQRGFKWVSDGILLSLHGRFFFCFTGFHVAHEGNRRGGGLPLPFFSPSARACPRNFSLGKLL